MLPFEEEEQSKRQLVEGEEINDDEQLCEEIDKLRVDKQEVEEEQTKDAGALTAIVQVLSLLEPFRDRVENISDWEHMHNENCVICALKGIFVSLTMQDKQQEVPPSVASFKSDLAALRRTKFTTFQNGHIDGASQVYSDLLHVIHALTFVRPGYFEAESKNVYAPCHGPWGKTCITHELFGIIFGIIMKEHECMDLGVSEYDRVSVPLAAIDIANLEVKEHALEEYIMKNYLTGTKDCFGGCAKTIPFEIAFTNPRFLVLDVDWSTIEDEDAITLVLEKIPPNWNAKLFDNIGTFQYYDIVSMVCYVPTHFMSFCCHKGNWILFDEEGDAEVVGSWEQVIELNKKKTCKSCMLFYGARERQGKITKSPPG